MNSLRKQIGWTAGICALSFFGASGISGVLSIEHNVAAIEVHRPTKQLD